MSDSLLIELTFATEPETRKSFPSVEALRAYCVYEQKCTIAQFKSYCKAYTPEERRTAQITLARARLRAYARWQELAAPTAPPTLA